MSQAHEGFVALKLQIGDGAVTISKNNAKEILNDLMVLGLSEVEAGEVLDLYKEGFLRTIGKGAVSVAEGVNNVTKPVSQGGLGAKPVVEQGPVCGHGVPRQKVNGKFGPFWACRAKDEQGNFLFKKKEGCAPLDIKEG